MSTPTFATRLAEVAEAKAALLDEARPEAIARQHRRGKKSVRERLAALFDDGVFDELGALASSPAEDRDEFPADGMITGIGRVGGRFVAVAAQDFSVYGGSFGPYGSLKVHRLLEHCLNQGIPLVLLLDSGGHRIQGGQDSWHFARGGTFFQDLAALSGWVPIVAAVMGEGFAAATNLAGLADFVVMVRGIATMGIAGPLLVKAATGGDISKEELGGAAAQVDVNGLAHLGVDTEEQALDAVRRYLSYLPSNARERPPVAATGDPRDRRSEVLAEIVPADTRKPYDVRRVITEIADRESVFEIQPKWGANAVTAFARMDGRPVGFIANQPMRLGGMITAQACEKIARFIAICDAYGLPLLYLIDVPGFAIGPSAEKSMLGRRSAKLVFELAHATVPRISLVLRKGYGMAYFAMAGGQGFVSDASLAWPTAEICPMSIEGSVDVAYRKDYEAAPDPAARRAELVAEMRRAITPLRAAGGLGVDDIIEPADTRRYLNDILSRAGGRRPNRMPPKYRAISPV
ncbi:acyl-CoA carboxylase subunit beta [Phytohabitans kaempferiae]|uniref:Acyl-CoA carboxylase subunit beta n=1 Tax=Phytohabitans kaempferiae TaxID=1620943 RepID=A0ABV6M5N7_9ACTN